MSYILPYSVEAYREYYSDQFMSGFTHRSLASGQCDGPRSKELVVRLNRGAERTYSTVSFNEEMLSSNQLDGGACSAIAFRVAKKVLGLIATLQASTLPPANQERSFIIQFMQIVGALEEIATSKKAPDKCKQAAIRTEQVALNTITVDRERVSSGAAVAAKVGAMASFYGLKTVESTSELRVKGNTQLKEQLNVLVQGLNEGVYFLRIIQEKYNHKLEEKGHSIVYVKKGGAEYYFDPALGAYALFSDLLYSSLRSANARFGVDLLSFHRLEEENPLILETFSLTTPPLYGRIYYPQTVSFAVIFSPGLGGSVGSYSALSEELCREGFVVICVNFPKTGVGTPKLQQRAIIERGVENSDHLKELVTLIHNGRFARIAPGVPIGVMGHSLGGSSSVAACRTTPEIQAAVNLDGRILDPTCVTQPILQFVATQTHEDRTEYKKVLRTLMKINAHATSHEVAVKHGDFATPDPAFLRRLVTTVARFFRENLKEVSV
ncbi:MAG: hypothetical protein S4CHLAM2_07420 [Chlamydiales bacterium]|nr:hypothetical protein [Chlamydiales bacterium]